MAEIATLRAGGLRGLSRTQELRFAVSNGTDGSGLTVLVGSNNSGKSTLIEALRLVTDQHPRSISDGKRNKAFDDKVEITMDFVDGSTRTFSSIRSGGSETQFAPTITPESIVVVPSRRTFTAQFGDYGTTTRKSYAANQTQMRAPMVDHFAGRLFAIDRDTAVKARFQKMFSEVVHPAPDWTIDQNDAGQYFVRFAWPSDSGSTQIHSSDGVGDGLISLLFVVDSLYDSEPGSTTVIDEPELSLHPQLQKRLRELISTLSATRQIVIATHSPYFVSWQDVNGGARVARVARTKDGTTIFQPDATTLGQLVNLSRDNNNPHVLGLEANEVFFLEDDIILVEGQEDVIFFRKIFAEFGFRPQATFFGWGVGGAEKMPRIAKLLEELGFSSVIGILDNDKLELQMTLSNAFPRYRFETIPADDIRPKDERNIAAKQGLTDGNGKVRDEHREETTALLKRIAGYLDAETSFLDRRAPADAERLLEQD